MKARKATILWAFGLTLLLSTTSTLQLVTTFAAPVSAPSSPGSSVPLTQPNVPLASEDCRRCLAQELIRIPKCDSLSVNTPALLPSERDPVKIKEYKTHFPDVVECLCEAASLAQGSGGWVKRCDGVCTGAVEKNQRRILNAFSEQFSCESNNADSTTSFVSSSSSSSSNPSSLSKPDVETEAKSQPSVAPSSSSARQPLSRFPAKVAPAAAAMPLTSMRPSTVSNTHSGHPARL
ncbi:hypothetical protein BGZ70_002571 [Mortierella alpina]|uniref:Uncharacterized protein n=1 Tax=Mortierella alpina TaxID=64518 RepID=A0A9P6LWY2_MORAP|nr:hypothetical protein BGZ70_002571 [Mortierella alpina]